LTIAAVLLAVALTPGSFPDRSPVDYGGTIGRSPIRMNLWRDGEHVEGYYVYESRYVSIDLAGSLQGDGHLRLSEKGRSGGSKESFSGLVSGDHFEGTWTPRGQGKKQTFRLALHRGAWRPPASWRRFEHAGCPVTFSLPGHWLPRDAEGSTTLDTIADREDDGLSVKWGKDADDAKPYEREGDRWFLYGENGRAPATDSLRVNSLRVSRDDRPCRVYSSEGYQGLGDCACALVHGPGFWVTFDSLGQRYAPALDEILTTLQTAAGR